MIPLLKGRRHLARAAIAIAAALAPLLLAPTAEARAPIRCTAVAIDASGRYILGTEAQDEDEARRFACQRALVKCDARLREVRYKYFRKLPTARCELVEAIPTNAYDPYDPAYRDNLQMSRPANIPAYVGGGYNQGRCNFSLCASKYKSFRSSDCSYQPYGGGPRRICDLGAPAPRPQFSYDPGYCNYAACSHRFRSFRDTDCTYVATSGRRLRCAIGPEVQPRPNLIRRSEPSPYYQPPAPSYQGYCNYAACSRAYKSFRDYDCTFQPYSGPRRLCTL